MNVVFDIAVCGLLSWRQFYVVMLPDRIHIMSNELKFTGRIVAGK